MKKAFFGLGVAVVSSAAALACSSSSSPATPEPDASTPVEDAATPVPDGAAPATDGGVACATGATLYDRLGGYAGIHSALEAIVKNELADPDIASYFFNQVATAQIEDCFAVLLSQAAGGPYTYPPAGGVTNDAGVTFVCRDMATIHQPLLISGGSFDQFVSIAAATLSPSVCAADLATIGSALEGTKPVIVYAPLADAGLEPFPGNTDAGN
jgi:hypothetical protein